MGQRQPHRQHRPAHRLIDPAVEPDQGLDELRIPLGRGPVHGVRGSDGHGEGRGEKPEVYPGQENRAGAPAQMPSSTGSTAHRFSFTPTGADICACGNEGMGLEEGPPAVYSAAVFFSRQQNSARQLK